MMIIGDYKDIVLVIVKELKIIDISKDEFL